MDSFLQDLRYALRRTRQNPGFTLLAVVIIGLGIGANTAIFSLVNAVLFKPLPYETPSELVRFFTTESNGSEPGAVSYPDLIDFQEREDLFSGVVATSVAVASLVTDDGSESLMVEYTSADFFQVMGLNPSQGRAFVPEEEVPGGSDAVAIVSYKTWQRRHGGDPDVVGATVRLNGKPVTIVGVGPQDFDGNTVGINTEYWTPFGTAAAIEPGYEEQLQNRGGRGLMGYARVQPGVNLAQASSGLNVLQASLAELYPQNENRSVVVMAAQDVRLHPVIDGVLYPIAAFLMVIVGLVLVVACTNLANLLLVKASSRSKEVAIRVALGAKRSRLVSQLLTESTLLGVMGGVVGLGIAYWIAHLIVSFNPPLPIPVAIEVTLDRTVLLYTMVIAVATGLLFGLIPSLRASRPDIVTSLKGGNGMTAGKVRRFSASNVLIVLQMSFSILLLIAAGLFLRGLGNAQQVDPGFETRNIAMATVDLSLGGYDQEAAQVFLGEVKRGLEGHPGIRSVAFADQLPLGAGYRTRGIAIEGYELPGNEMVEVNMAVVDGAYFDVLEVPLVAGRNFAAGDAEGSPGVAIVSEAMASRYWDDDNVVGQRIFMGTGENAEAVEVVGVARDTKVNTLGESPRPYLYLPVSQNSERFITIVAATEGDPAAIPDVLRRELVAMNPELPILETKTMEEHLTIMLFAPRMAAILLSAFGGLALVLACIGLYGVVAFSVTKRNRELGIRIALGARHEQVMAMVIRESMVLVIVGVVVGLVFGFFATKPLAGMLNGISTVDPVTFLGVPLVLAGVALLASYLPARRVVKVSPMAVLKED